MQASYDRVEWLIAALQDAELEALVCTVPTNVLLLSGYWPVVGTAVAIATAEGRVAVLAPEDERDLASAGWATDVRTYQPGSLDSLTRPDEAIRAPLGVLLRDLRLHGGRIGYEDGAAYEPASYASLYLFRSAAVEILGTAAPHALLVTGHDPIARLRSRLTPNELGRVRLACLVASAAFASTAQGLRPGQREPEVAAALSTPIVAQSLAQAGVQRAGAFTFCMSGPNASLAGAAYARTRNRELRTGDLVLVHCNSYIDGYWTDITRTYSLGTPDTRQKAMYEAVFAARSAALAAIHPGARAAAVDEAARVALTARGFGDHFTHGLGHTVGFSAISAEFPPRLHPNSPDLLEEGMTFNVEPAIYIAGYGGLRHCDVVTVGADGPEVLTPFQAEIKDLIIYG